MQNSLSKISLICLVTIVFLGTIAGCAGQPGTGTPPAARAFTDQSGRTVVVKAPPQRIVSLAPANTEILFALGLADKIAGVTDYCDYPPEAKRKPSIGGFSTPNIEEIVAKDPDLVLTAPIHEKTIVPELEARGLTVLTIAPKTIADILAAITLVGSVTGKEKEAAALVADMQRRIDAVTFKIAPLSSRPSACFVVWHDPLMIAGAGTFHDELIAKAGGMNIGHDLAGYTQDFSLENLVAADPQVIIVGVGMGTGEDLPLQFINTEPRLKDITARINHRVYAIDQDIAGRAGPRIVDALEQFAQDIHPALFK